MMITGSAIIFIWQIGIFPAAAMSRIKNGNNEEEGEEGSDGENDSSRVAQ